MANRNKDTERGAVLLEFTLVIPVLLTIVLGTVDLAVLMMDWASLNRATYAGARYAAVSDPVPTGINNAIAATSSGSAGQNCINSSTGASSGKCSITGSSCYATSATTGGTVTCTNSFTGSPAALDAIVSTMNSTLIGSTVLDRRQVLVTYTPTNIGYVMRPGGSPMNITVKLRCARHKFFFLTSIMQWVFSTPAAACSGIGAGTDGVAISTFSTTVPSEDLYTNP